MRPTIAGIAIKISRTGTDIAPTAGKVRLLKAGPGMISNGAGNMTAASSSGKGKNIARTAGKP